MKLNPGLFMPMTAESFDIECHNIARWWIENSVDKELGGFFGELDACGEAAANANKGVVLNARILWFFSEASFQYDNDEYRKIADRAFDYLLKNFDDHEFGGVVWELDATGICIDGKKQIYAQSFAIYGLSAYYQLTGEKKALQKAMEYFSLIERNAIDPLNGGYLEAFSQDWSPLSDVRLSDKDLNFPKSMNTHIHVLEAYTSLFRVSSDPTVKIALKDLLVLICDKIINPRSHHLYLFQDLEWQDKSDSISYGHDIECSWLLWDALTVLGEATLKATYRTKIMRMAEVALSESLGDKGQVCDQLSLDDNEKHVQSLWWVQAEALVGFLNAYQMTGNPAFLSACEKIWLFIQDQHIDHDHGEWHWIATCHQVGVAPLYKAGFWKAPYHNGRAMMESAALLRVLQEQTYEMAK